MAVISGGKIIEGAISRGSGGAGGVGGGYIVVADRAMFPFSAGTGAVGGITMQTAHTVYRDTNLIRLVYANIRANNGEVDGAQVVTLHVGIEDPDNAGDANHVRKVTYNGSLDIVLEPGAVIVTDPIGVDLSIGDTLKVRTWCDADNTEAYQYGYSPQSADGTGISSGSDLAYSGGIGTNSTPGVAPVCILGIATAPAISVVAVGDSITNGSGWRGDPMNLSYATYACRAAGIPWSNIARSSETTPNFLKMGRRRRMIIAAYHTHAIVMYGTNDILSSGTALATVQANIIDIGNALRLAKIKAFLCTLIPQTATSSDGWKTVAGQTIASAPREAVRVAYNNWVRSAPWAQTAAYPFVGYFETADTVESARDSGKFLAPEAAVDTGTATAGNTTTLTDSGKTWTTNAYKGMSLRITGGTGSGQVKQIHSNTATVLTISGTMTAPSTDSTYEIINAYTPDGIHPSNRGHIAMSAAILADSFTL